MVKVMIEDDKNKDEITGEFFMGLMLTKEEKTEDSTTYKACAIGTGNTCVQDLPNNVAKWLFLRDAYSHLPFSTQFLFVCS